MIPRDSGVYGSATVTPSKTRIVEKTNICQKCGDKGDLKRLIYCVQCKAFAEHSYCLEKLHKEDDGTVDWKCEECTPNDPKCGSEQLRKSERISHATEAKYKRKKMQKESGSVKKQKSVRSSEDESSNYLRKNDIANGNKGFPSKKRRLILEDENFSYEESESLKGPLNISSESQLLYYPESDKCSRAEPLSDPVWRGLFRLNNTTHLGLAAYISSKACSKVHLAVTGLPKLLDVKMLLRSAIWPRSFDMFPPNGESIALYIFPQYERDEKVYDGVLNNVIERDLALKAVINNVELLIFCSHLLPPDNRRIFKKYYLWGVFKPKPKSGNTQSN